MFKKIVSLVLIYFQIIVPEYYMYEAISQLVQPAPAYADVANPVQNPVCDKRCYDARTDNPQDWYWHYYNAASRTMNFNISKGINIYFWVKVKTDGYYVQGDKLNVYQSGDTATLSFVHPDGKTYTMTLKSKKNTWVVFGFSINPNFIAGVSRNADTGEFDEQVFEFPYNPIDFDDPTKSYNIVFTEGVLADGMYHVGLNKPFPSGVRPFCSEQIAFCHHEWTDSTSRVYQTDPNRINFSLAWWGKEDIQGMATCTWYDENSHSYICDKNRGSLFRNTSTELRDGAEGMWARAITTVSGSYNSQPPVQIPNWCDIRYSWTTAYCYPYYATYYKFAPFISHTTDLIVPGDVTYVYRFKFRPGTDCVVYDFWTRRYVHPYLFYFVMDDYGTLSVDGTQIWSTPAGQEDVTTWAAYQIPYSPDQEHVLEVKVTNASNDSNTLYGYNATGMALKAVCGANNVTLFNTGSPGWEVVVPAKVYDDQIGIIQSKTENNIKETYGHELNKGTAMPDPNDPAGGTLQWELRGFRRVAPGDPPPGGPVGRLTVSAPPALQPASLDSNRKVGWDTYQFSNNWFWKDTGVLPKQCPATGPQVGGAVTETLEACWEYVADLCKVGDVNLYPVYDDCYHFIENAGCWDGQVQFGTQCYIYNGVPSVCPTDGNYTIITPPAQNYMCHAENPPLPCPSGTVQEGANCYSYTDPNPCPSPTVLNPYNGYCQYRADPYCPPNLTMSYGFCYDIYPPSCPHPEDTRSGQYCFYPQGASDPCPANFAPILTDKSYVCLSTVKTYTDFDNYVTSVTCYSPRSFTGPANYKGLCYTNPYTNTTSGRIDYFAQGYIMHDPVGGDFVCDSPGVGYYQDCGCAYEVYNNWGLTGQSVIPRVGTNCFTCATGYSPWLVYGGCFKTDSYAFCPAGGFYDYSRDACAKYVQNACPSGYGFDSNLQKCVQNYSYACPGGSSFDTASQQCKSYITNICAGYGSGWSYDSSKGVCVKNVYAECPSGQVKLTDPNTGYYACYTLDLSHGQPPGHIYCRNNLTIYRDRCYQYIEPICNSQQYTLIHGSANSYGEWTGTCWNDFDRPCPSGTFKGRGEHTTDIHCLKPELEVLNIKVPVTQEEFSDKFCNALLYYKAGPTGYKPCTNIPQTGNWTGCPDSFYVGEGRGPWSCPMNPRYDCIQITDFMSMCGIDKNCAACYPSNIEGNTYNYVEIQEIKDIPNTNPKKVTGKYANQYNYPNAKQRVTQVSGRLPYPSEVNVIQSLWGTTNFWVDDQPPVACNVSSSSSACLNDVRDVVVVWDDATKAGFYAACVYTSTGDAVCTGDAVDCVNGVCPINSALPCADWNGKKICSATKCKSAADPAAGETEIVTIDDTMYQNDGPRDKDGNCLGQIYIFTGKGSRCRPPGVTVGLLNDCCESGNKVVSDSTGSAMSLYGAISTVKDLYYMGKAAYYAYQIANGTYSVYMVDGAVVAGMTPNITMTSSMVLMNPATGQLVDIAGKGMAIVTYQGGMAGVESAASTAITNYVQNVLLNPTTLAIQAAIYVVTKLLFGNGCDNNDITTVMLRDSKYCHFVGDYCEKKWPIIGCVQKAKGYCCFNSKLGRIIHEQGRPQLKAFQPDGNWGEGKKPYCRGFTPEEFQMLDFSKIDLSEYFEDIQKDMDKKLQQMQETATQKVNEFYNRMSR